MRDIRGLLPDLPDDGVPGYTGSRGSDGVTGYTGSSGYSGYTGSAGTDGATGFTGSRGVIGFTGSKGAIGFTGSRGFNGQDGLNGFNGSQGFTGSQGDLGYTGSRGLTGSGFVGSQGVMGFTGSKGDLGYTGSTGAGYTGSQGIIGFTGSVGYSGSQGPRGFSGIDGFVGSKGYTGSRAFTGSQGYTGSQGVTGFVGSQGDIGFTGSRAFTGSQGYTGSQGITGFVGSQGIVGFTGSQGTLGVDGFTGSRGFTGSAGNYVAKYTIWDPLVPDSSPHVLTDEFTDPASMTNWTGVYTGDAGVINDIATTTSRGMHFELPSTGGPTYRFRARMKAILAGDFTIHTAIATAMSVPSGSGAATAGIILADGVTPGAGKLTMAAVARANSTSSYHPAFVRVTWANYGNDPTSAVIDQWEVTDPSPLVFMRLRRVGANYFQAFSKDGEEWVEQSMTLLSGLTPTHFGLAGNNYVSSGVSKFNFRYFRVYATGTQYLTGGLRTIYG